MTREARAAITDFAILAVVMAVAAAQSWLRWLDPVIDTGRDLYIAEALGRGVKLYRDIRYQYPPLAPYLLAGITKATGHSLAAYAAIGFAQSVAIAALLWFTARRLGGRWAALGAALLFAAMNFTGASTFGANFVFPYSYAATLGMLFVVAFAACVAYERMTPAVVFAVAASWCKVEYAVAMVIAVVAFALARKIRWRDVVAFAAAMVIATVAAISIFGADALRDNVFASSLTSGATSRHFFSLVAGTAFWRERIVESLIGAVILIAIELLLWRGFRKIAMAAAIVIGLFAPVAVLFRGCGLLQWGALVRPRDRWMFALAALSIASTLRVALNVAPVWYGFVLIVPLYLLIANATRGDVVWLALIVAACCSSLAGQRARYAVKEFAIETPRGRFYDANADRAAILSEAIPQLRGGTLAVFPEGISLNYFAGAPATLTFHTFTPAETKDPRIENRILGELAAHPPDRVVILTRDLREYGSAGFGVDYDQRLRAFLESRYALSRRWVRPRFSLTLLTRVE